MDKKYILEASLYSGGVFLLLERSEIKYAEQTKRELLMYQSIYPDKIIFTRYGEKIRCGDIEGVTIKELVIKKEDITHFVQVFTPGNHSHVWRDRTLYFTDKAEAKRAYDELLEGMGSKKGIALVSEYGAQTRALVAIRGTEIKEVNLCEMKNGESHIWDE